MIIEKLKAEHYESYWKHIMKASGINDYDVELKIEDI
jgi:hypothetical protein